MKPSPDKILSAIWQSGVEFSANSWPTAKPTSGSRWEETILMHRRSTSDDNNIFFKWTDGNQTGRCNRRADPATSHRIKSTFFFSLCGVFFFHFTAVVGGSCFRTNNQQAENYKAPSVSPCRTVTSKDEVRQLVRTVQLFFWTRHAGPMLISVDFTDTYRRRKLATIRWKMPARNPITGHRWYNDYTMNPLWSHSL